MNAVLCKGWRCVIELVHQDEITYLALCSPTRSYTLPSFHNQSTVQIRWTQNFRLSLHRPVFQWRIARGILVPVKKKVSFLQQFICNTRNWLRNMPALSCYEMFNLRGRDWSPDPLRSYTTDYCIIIVIQTDYVILSYLRFIPCLCEVICMFIIYPYVNESII